MTLACVVNISEGRDADVIGGLTEACGADLLDLHTDPDHNRSVFTLVGEDAPRHLARAAVETIDLRTHEGVHPRLGVVDVVPFVALDGEDATASRNRFARWAADELDLPCFLYGPERSLPDVRRQAFATLLPDLGRSTPHPTAGACAVGVRSPLVAYNVWLDGDALDAAFEVARRVRGPHLRALGLQVGDRVQVSMNLIDPGTLGPDVAFDLVAREAEALGFPAQGAELVGLVPRAVLDRIPSERWASLNLSATRTIEHRLAQRERRLGG